MAGQIVQKPFNNEPKFFYGYIVVAAAFIIMVLAWGTFFSFGIFFKPLVNEFGWTSAMTSGAFTLSSLIRGTLSIVTGKLSDKFSLRIVTTTCCLLLASGFLLMSRISAVWQLYLIYGVIVATGMAGCWAPLIATVARWFVKRRGLMTGIVTSGIGVGGVIPLVATRLISTYDWRMSYLILGSTLLVVIVLAAQLLRHDPHQIGQLPYGANEIKQESLSPEAKGFSIQDAIHTRQFLVLCATYFCYGFFMHAIMVHIVPHATELGISPISAANILAIISGVSIVGRITIGSVSDRIGINSSLVAGFILSVLVLLWLQLAEELWMLYLFAVIFGFAYGGLSASPSLIASELFGLSSLGVIVGSFTFSFTVGNAVGVFLSGHIFDITGSYYPAFWVCAAAGVAGLVLIVLLKPIGGKSEQNEEHSGI